MKIRKICYIAIMLFLVSLILSATAFAFTETFSSRGNAAYETAKYPMTGKICRMYNNKVKVEIDRNTPNRNISYKMQYWTPGFLGMSGIADEITIIDNKSLGNSSSNYVSYLSFPTGTRTFVDSTYGANDKASIRAFATGASSAYNFTIIDAKFEFSDN